MLVQGLWLYDSTREADQGCRRAVLQEVGLQVEGQAIAAAARLHSTGKSMQLLLEQLPWQHYFPSLLASTRSFKQSVMGRALSSDCPATHACCSYALRPAAGANTPSIQPVQLCSKRWSTRCCTCTMPGPTQAC